MIIQIDSLAFIVPRKNRERTHNCETKTKRRGFEFEVEQKDNSALHFASEKGMLEEFLNW